MDINIVDFVKMPWWSYVSLLTAYLLTVYIRNFLYMIIDNRLVSLGIKC